MAAIFLVALLLVASAGRCEAQVPPARTSIASFDPCHQKQAPANDCVLLTCKVFMVGDAPRPCVASAAEFVSFVPVEKLASGRLVQPPLPPPRLQIV